ncbi:MAG: sulfotransferase family protein [bacterium]
MYYISFVVDDSPQLYYQAELLLTSLSHIGWSKERIIIQCTENVSTSFTGHLRKNKYHYTHITPILDKKYCNKLQQLAYFVEKKEQIKISKGVILIDTDTFFITPPSIPNHQTFYAKIVDGSNPPLATLKKIYQQAKLTEPEITHSDWGDGETYNNNFNGGFYFIPQRYIVTIQSAWLKWAHWLFERADELLPTATQRMHIDQISMGMTLIDLKINYSALATNTNYPAHTTRSLNYYNKNSPISMLHYHQNLDVFGFIDSKEETEQAAKTAIQKANQVIAQSKGFHYFSNYKTTNYKNITPSQNIRNLGTKIKEHLTVKSGQIKRFILHAGTPKTGTTSLQFFLKEAQDKLKKKGIAYPHIFSETYAPKHQWMVPLLLNNKHDIFIEKLSSALTEAGTAETIILSTEGIYNHWWDFPENSKALLAEVSQYFDFEVWVWFRPHFDFAKSFYLQNLKNPQIPLVQCYGKDLSLPNMLTDPWFRQHLDYIGFIEESKILFGKNAVRAFAFSGDTIKDICDALDLPSHNKDYRENTQLSQPATEILRIINRYPLTIAEKTQAVDLTKTINKLLNNATQNTPPSYLNKEFQDAQRTIEELTQPSSLALQKILTQDSIKSRKTNNNTVAQRRAIIVIGMHRSGTSVIARIFTELGFHPPHDLMPAQKDNPAGFCEPLGIVRLNNKILNALNSHWDDTNLLTLGGKPIYSKEQIKKLTQWVLEKYQDEMMRTIKTSYSNLNHIIVKDPRLTLLHPAWEAVFIKSGYNVETVTIVRHYQQVTQSLKRRNNFTLKHALKLWIKYNHYILTTKPALVIHFDEIVKHPSTLTTQLSKLLLSHSTPITTIKKAIRNQWSPPSHLPPTSSKEIGKIDTSLIKTASNLYTGLTSEPHTPYSSRAYIDDKLINSLETKQSKKRTMDKMGNKRTIIFHYHLFKNAGTSLDSALKKHLGEDNWATKEFSGPPHKNREAVVQWIKETQSTCFSSHTAHLPPPDIDGIEIKPLIFIRHPIDRIASAYAFERKQGGNSFGSVLARNTSFAGYVETRLALPNDSQCRNFHTGRFAHYFPSSEQTDQLSQAKHALEALPFIGIVEYFNESMGRIEQWLRHEGFPNIQLEAVTKNASRSKKHTLEEKLHSIKQDLGETLYQILIEANQDDLSLYEAALQHTKYETTTSE